MSKGEQISYAVFDPAVFGDKQHHSLQKDAREGNSGAEIMQQTISKLYEDAGNPQDSFLITRADNRRIEGWRNVKQILRVKDNESDFKVFSSCTNFTTTFPANVHDDKRPEDLNTDGEDHTADEFRYGIMSRPPETDLKHKENLSHLSPEYHMQKLRRQREGSYN